MKTRIVYSDRCLNYGTWHVEGPQRVKSAKDTLYDRGYEFVEPKPATEDQLMSVHDPEYLWNLKKGLVEDTDTPAYDKIFDYASLSAGAAILASKICGFSLTRPPGHHVGRFGAALGVYTRGFCYLNNIAIAVKELNKPTLILDIDGHHGNGTQEIFLGDEKVTYIINGFREHRSVDSNIRSYSLTYPTEKLKILALQSGLYSRFKVDPNFKNNEFGKLYEQWIVNSVKKITASECLVYFDGEVEKGFITLAIKEDTGSIGLIAVDEMERGKSIGRKLLNASFDYFSKRNIDRVEVVTQKANESACVFYEKLGFEVKNIINIYHLWLI
jgi:ribosomal protein S18 acetylase RimI-like enzyme